MLVNFRLLSFCNIRLINRTMTSLSSAHIKTSVDDIIKSAEDKRLYRGLELNNGLKILLISDAKTDKSGASLDVNIGGLSDPDNIPGLAHFCEHMLFLGTKKYATENNYSKYLSENGGDSNAFTSSENTNFYFDVKADALEGALDRFAQFFLSPLFTASATEREVDAVNSENTNNLNNDMWRGFQLAKSMAKPGHPYAKFQTGNKKTLLELPRESGIEVRDELLKFHASMYSSNLMGLAVLGVESLDDLQEMVVPMFCEVKNTNKVRPQWLEHPYGEGQVKMRCNQVPIKNSRSLKMTWGLPDLHQYYKAHPTHIVSHLIGHESKGSILSELKSKGWINSLSAGASSNIKGFSLFEYRVDLTEEGMENIDEIIENTFQYIRMLKEEGPKEWIYKECRDLDALSFRFKDKERPQSYVKNCASCIHEFPLKEVLSGGYLLEEYRPDLYTKVIDLLNPENMIVHVIGQKFKGQTDKIEQWYGTEHTLEKIPESTLKKWINVELNEKYHLPKPNEFIATDFSILPNVAQANIEPNLLLDQPLLRLWHKSDNEFKLPKTFISGTINTPYGYIDPLSAGLTYIYMSLVRDSLTEFGYDAELSGLNYELFNSIYGVTFAFHGYNHKLKSLIEKCMQPVVNLEIDENRFNINLETYTRTLRNFSAEKPFQQANFYMYHLISEQIWTKEELLDTVDEITIDRLKVFAKQIFSRLHFNILVYGNNDEKEALSYANIIETSMKKYHKCKPLLESQLKINREFKMTDGSNYMYERENHEHANHALVTYLQCGLETSRSNMLIALVAQVLKEPFFNQLRTIEQLGYIVNCSVRSSCGVNGLRLIIQSLSKPAYLDSRVEIYLTNFRKEVESMDEIEYKKHIESLAIRILEKPKKMISQMSKYWSEIFLRTYEFNRDEVEVAILRTLTKEQLLAFYDEYIIEGAGRRHKLSVHVISTKEVAEPEGHQVTEADLKGSNIQKILLTSEFKRNLELFPNIKSNIKLHTNIAADLKSKL